LVLTNQTNYYT